MIGCSASSSILSRSPIGPLRHLAGFRRRKPQEGPSPKEIERAADRCKVLIDAWLNPPGSFRNSHYVSAREALAVLSSARPLGVEYSHLPIYLFERIVTENATLRSKKELRWILDPRATLYPVLRIWKEAREQAKDLAVSPQVLIQTFQEMSETLPDFKYNEISMGRILEIVIQQTDREIAGDIAKNLLDYIQKMAKTPLQKSQVECPKLYNLVIAALAKSSNANVEKEIELLGKEMQKKNVVPDLGTYQLLVKFWSDRDNDEKVDQLLEKIRQEPNHYEMNGTILNEAIRCYCRKGYIDKAERTLREMVDTEQQFCPTIETEAAGAWSTRQCRYDLLAHAVQNLMLAYRTHIFNADTTLSDTEKTDAAQKTWERAKSLFEMRVRSHNLLDVVTTNRLVAVMMDIHKFAGKLDHEDAVARYLKFNDRKHNNLSTLVKSLGRDGMVRRGTDIVFRGMSDPKTSPFITPKVIVSLLHAWAESSSEPDRIEQAWKVLNQYNSSLEPQSLNRSIQTSIYNALLKVILKSHSNSMGEQAQFVLDEMERLNIFPDKLSYERAIKACILANDKMRKRELLRRMRLSASPPDGKSYQEFEKLEKIAQKDHGKENDIPKYFSKLLNYVDEGLNLEY